MLLQTASPDALIRLKHSPLADQREELLKVYFQQHRGSLEDFLAYHLQTNGTQGESLLMQVDCDSGRVKGKWKSKGDYGAAALVLYLYQ